MEYKQNHDLQEPLGRSDDVQQSVSAAEIAAALDEYNAWRRGGTGAQPDPTALGLLIGAAANMLRSLEREVTHWQSNHATEVRRARILKERTDMPMERVAAYHQWIDDQNALFRMTAEVARLRQQNDGALFVGAGKRKYEQLRDEGFKPVGLALQKDDKRCWISGAGMVLWPRLETEVSDEKVELANLRREVVTLRKQLNDDADVCNVCDKGSMRKAPRFPVELRKMWSGAEVQKWLDANA